MREVEEFTQLSSWQIDAIKEIGNIGAGNAATALSQMVQAKINIGVPRVSILPFAQVPNIFGSPDTQVVGIYFNVTGSAPSSILLIIKADKAELLINMLLMRSSGQTDINNLNELEKSALMELGNIISAKYLNAMSMFTQLDFVASVPALGIDMAGAILNAILAQFGEIADHVLLLETDFTQNDNEVVVHFFLLPEPDSLAIILEALGVTD